MERLDVGFDGQLYLLGHASEGVGRPDVLKVSPTGELDRAFVADLATVPLPLNDIAVRADGRIYLSSPATLSLTVLAPDGTLVDTLSMFHDRQLLAAWPVAVAGGPAVLPADIALDDRHVYVSDLGHNRLLVFDHAGVWVFDPAAAPPAEPPPRRHV